MLKKTFKPLATRLYRKQEHLNGYKMFKEGRKSVEDEPDPREDGQEHQLTRRSQGF